MNRNRPRPPRPARVPRSGLRWPMFAGYLAVLWSVAYGLIALTWLDGDGYPFGPEADPEAGLSALGGVPEEVGAPAIVLLAFVGAGIAVLMLRGYGAGAARRAILAFGAPR